MEQQILDGMYEQLGISKEVLDYAADICLLYTSPSPRD